MIFILSVSVFIIVSILFGGLALHLISKLFKIENATYKKSLFISLLSGVGGILITLVLSYINLGILSAVLAVVAPAFLFHLLLKRFYGVGWGKSLGIYVIMGLIGIIVASIISVPLRSYVVEPFIVSGSSMEPTYPPGTYFLINKWDKVFHRGDVITLHLPDGTDGTSLKRIIGLPLEKIEIRNFDVFINGLPLDEGAYKGNATKNVVAGEVSITLGEDQYFVLGDNRDGSYDSRSFGPISRADIGGKAWFIWTKESFEIIGSQQYGGKQSGATVAPTSESVSTWFRFSYPTDWTVSGSEKEETSYQVIARVVNPARAGKPDTDVPIEQFLVRRVADKPCMGKPVIFSGKSAFDSGWVPAGIGVGVLYREVCVLTAGWPLFVHGSAHDQTSVALMDAMFASFSFTGDADVWAGHENAKVRFGFRYPQVWKVEDGLNLDSGVLNIFNSTSPYQGDSLKEDVMKAQFQYHFSASITSKQEYIDRLVKGNGEIGGPIINRSSIASIKNENGIDILKFSGGVGDVGYVIPRKSDFSEVLYVIVWNPDLVFEEVLCTVRWAQ